LASSEGPFAKALKPKVEQLCGQSPSNSWVRDFIKEHKDLKTSRAQGLDPKRARAFNFGTVDAYFKMIQKLVEEKQIPTENMYNMDEKGIQVGGGRTGNPTQYFFSREDRATYKLRDGNLKLVTVIESCCADGTTFLPGFVFPGKEVDHYQSEETPPVRRLPNHIPAGLPTSSSSHDLLRSEATPGHHPSPHFQKHWMS
jgi:hypothetical protein